MDNEIRLIDANALKEFINNGRVCDICPNKKLNCAIHCDFPDTLTPLLEKVIDNAPTVCNDNYAMGYQDGIKKVLSERPQGEWIKESNGKTTDLYICSVCKRSIMLCKGADLTNYPFCHCGADMRGGRE